MLARDQLPYFTCILGLNDDFSGGCRAVAAIDTQNEWRPRICEVCVLFVHECEWASVKGIPVSGTWSGLMV